METYFKNQEQEGNVNKAEITINCSINIKFENNSSNKQKSIESESVKNKSKIDEKTFILLWGEMDTLELSDFFGVAPSTIRSYATGLRKKGVDLFYKTKRRNYRRLNDEELEYFLEHRYDKPLYEWAKEFNVPEYYINYLWRENSN